MNPIVWKTIFLLVTVVAPGRALGQDMVPPPRFGHTLTPVGDVIYLYGGYSSGDSAEYLSELWAYQPLENSWITAPSVFDLPPGRNAHAAALCRGWGMPDVYLGITGGTGADGELNDLWVYYPDEQSWALKPPNGPEIPSPRTDHIAVWVDGRFYVYGGRGCCGTGVLGDLWAYDLEADLWEERQGYEPRYGHSVAPSSDSERFHVYGGMGTELYDNIVIYDTEDDSWEPLEVQGSVPPARRLHSSAYNESKMWIVGGLGDEGTLNDTWEYDFAGNFWVQKADAPVLSRTAASINVYNLNQFFLFGGLDTALNPTNELWRFDADLDEWEKLEPVGTLDLPLVAEYELSARPNPFRVHTSIFTSPRFPAPNQAILIHDIRGNLISTLNHPQDGFGNHDVSWDGTDRLGRVVPSGTYLVSTSDNGALRIVKLP